MALATELVPTVHPTTSIAGPDDLADRKGRTRQIVEARRLRDALVAT